MHQIAFDLKRAYLRTKLWGERAMGIDGMTQARFDLMCMLREKHRIDSRDDRGPLEIGVSQVVLQRRVDVSKQTTSMMLKRLERLGWVRRERGTGKRRRENIVYLTATGLQRIAKAMRILFRQRRFLAYFERVYKAVRPDGNRHVVWSLFETSERIQFVANAFGDRSDLNYDYGARRYADRLDWPFIVGPQPFDPLYEAPPPKTEPPKPLVGDARGDGRNWGFTEYETSVRAHLWGYEKTLPRKKRPPTVPPPKVRGSAVFVPASEGAFMTTALSSVRRWIQNPWRSSHVREP